MAKVAVVTGASRGIGRGIAAELASQGWSVFATGRSVASSDLPHEVRRLTCDHSDDGMVARTFEQILESAGRMDVLVNAVWGGYERMATDKMAADMAHELERHNVVVVSLYPGLVRTEAVLAANVFDLSNSESPEFVGRAVAALADDPQAMPHSGKVLVTAALAHEYGFRDIDDKRPIPRTLADV